MSSRTINTIIFDVGKVLVDWSPDKLLVNLGFNKETQKVVKNAMYDHPLWDDHDRGLLTDEEYLEQFVANAPDYEEEIRLAFSRDGEAIHLYPYAEDWIRSLKEQGYKLYILSNYSHNTYLQTEHKMAFLPYMDGALFSFTAHQRKPYLCIYRTLLERYSINPQEAIFIDDRQENIDAANSLGIHGIHFTNYENALKKLRGYSINI